MQTQRQGERLHAVGGLADDLHVWLQPQPELQPIADRQAIIGNQQPNGRILAHLVCLPALLTTCTTLASVSANLIYRSTGSGIRNRANDVLSLSLWTDSGRSIGDRCAFVMIQGAAMQRARRAVSQLRGINAVLQITGTLCCR